MRIGLNLLQLVPGAGGTGTYSRELVPALLAAEPSARITAFVSAELPDDVRDAPWAGEVEWVRYPVTLTHGPPGNIVALMAVQWGAMAWAAARRRVDVVHGLANIAPLAVPRAATVVTLHDLIWMRDTRAMDVRALLGMRLVAPASARAADRVIAITGAVRADIHATLGIPLERIALVNQGTRPPVVAPVPEAEARSALGVGAGPFVLCVAQKRTHKNLIALVRAAVDLPGVEVALVGAATPHEADLRAEAQRLGVADRVRFPGWLTEEQLEGAYRAAACFALPSFEEGFGLPVLDAMIRRVPVACSTAPALAEVAGGAAELFDPRSPESAAAAIRRVLADRERYVAAGTARAAAFSWERTARETLAAYREAIEARRR